MPNWQFSVSLSRLQPAYGVLLLAMLLVLLLSLRSRPPLRFFAVYRAQVRHHKPKRSDRASSRRPTPALVPVWKGSTCELIASGAGSIYPWHSYNMSARTTYGETGTGTCPRKPP